MNLAMTMHPARTINEFRGDILIVDDTLENIRFLSDFLTQQQYQVRKAISGQAALMAAKTSPPDLILLDVNMPGMTGYEVCQQLKQDPRTDSIPIIFLSAGNDLEDKIRAFQSGAKDYITKPFQLEEVLARVQTQLTIGQLQKQLEAQNAQLNQTLESLKRAQESLVQQEKMATLRKVVAGVAHEINNPLGFIASNIKPAQEYIHYLTDVLNLYQQKYGDSDPEIQALLADNDLNFVIRDLDNILTSMGTGASRIRTVVLALRIFTRLDESGVKPIAIQESIESALAMLQHRLQLNQHGKVIQISRDYDTLPPIAGHAAQLNQVMFHLFNNAIDAITERISQNPDEQISPEIAITTQAEQTHISIRIRDNGIGIPAEQQALIFEPFFTTKAAGQGIGLGLATSRRIIEEMHSGQLLCSSKNEVGTEFVIHLPLHSPSQAD